MAAARAFLDERNPGTAGRGRRLQPRRQRRSLTSRPTKQALAAAVATAPPLAEGTHIYDALDRGRELRSEDAGPRAHDRRAPLRRRRRRLRRDAARDALAGARATRTSASSRSASSRSSTTPRRSRRSRERHGRHVRRGASAGGSSTRIYAEIGPQLSSEYELTLPVAASARGEAAVVTSRGRRLPPPVERRTRRPTSGTRQPGTFEQSWIDERDHSPWLMVFVVVVVIALLGVRDPHRARRPQPLAPAPHGAVRHVADRGGVAPAARRRSRDARRHRPQRPSAGSGWWQRLRDGRRARRLRLSPLAIAGWTIVAASSRRSSLPIVLSPLGPARGCSRPFVTRFVVTRRVSKKRKAFDEQLPDNLDVLAGGAARRAHLVGALARHGRQRRRAVEVRVPPRRSRTSSSACRSTTRSWSRRGACRATTPSRSRSSCGSSARPAATRPRCSTASPRSSAAGMELRRLVRDADRAGPDLALDPHRLPIFVLVAAHLHRPATTSTR